MNTLDTNDFKGIFKQIGILMSGNKTYLCELDGSLGDGDIGVTMDSGFSYINSQLEEELPDDIGNLFIKCGFILSEKAPSTMGTLLGSSFLNVGKEFKGKDKLEVKDLHELFSLISQGIEKRGKAKIGDKTILDSLIPAINSLRDSNEMSDPTLKEALYDSYKAAEKGMESTIEMVAKKGRAARYLENSKGKQDPGATVGKLIFEGFYNYILLKEEKLCQNPLKDI